MPEANIVSEGMKMKDHNNGNITLYTYAMSPYAAKVHCFLLYKGLDFDCFYINPLRIKKDLPVGFQIPVLKIDEESRADSSPIGQWLDERFPDAPQLLPNSGIERDKAIELDNWVSHVFIAHHFRNYPGIGLNMRRIRNAWRLGGVMRKTASRGIPFLLFLIWPLVIGTVGFVRRMVRMANTDLSLKEARIHLFKELEEKLDGGPFLGGRQDPSMADFAAFPQLYIPYLIEFEGSEDFLEYPKIVDWMNSVKPYIEKGIPSLVPPVAVKRKAPEAFISLNAH